MKLKPIIMIVIFAVLIGAAVFTAQKEQKQQKEKETKTESNNTPGLKTGSKAPDFTLNTLDGKKISLSDFRGKKVILNFWATWCPPCREEMPEMARFYKDYQQKEVEILAVNLTYSESKVEKIKDFTKEYGITFQIPLDEKNTIGKQYRAIAIPTSYFIDEDGVIQNMHVGPMDYEFMKEKIKDME